MSWQDPHDVRRARHAPGLLRPFNDAAVLAVADVQVACGLGRLVGESDERVLLAAALAVRALRLGSVCVDLAQVRHTVTVDRAEPTDVQALPWPDLTAWLSACAASAAVAAAADVDAGRPLRLTGVRLYLDRYWREEECVATGLLERTSRPGPSGDAASLRSGLARLFPGPGPDGQRLAAAVAALRWLTVLAGGPGTGKTTTVARLLALLCAQPDEPPRIALAAPTGKAAARLEEAVRDAVASLPSEDRDRLGDLHASTLHRLLGARPDSRTRFRHDRHNRLPHDVVVVDETSMVSLSLMARLIEAVRPGARLVLVGDPEQLASVEAGAVLGDIVGRATVAPARSRSMRARLEEVVPGDLEVYGGMATGGSGVPGGSGGSGGSGGVCHGPAHSIGDGVVVLRHTWRFGGRIAELASAVQDGLADKALTLLSVASDDVSFVETADLTEPAAAALQPLRDDVVAAAKPVVTAAVAGDVAGAVRHLEVHRLLCAHRHGPFGVSRWAALVERWIAAALPGYGTDEEWYAGRPLLVTANDHDLKLYNGDVGVVVADKLDHAADGGLIAAFARGGAPVLVHPARLSAVQTVHAMTVHRSQGSQFHRVSVLLPPASSPLLTRELFYTAVTRARVHVRVIGSREAVHAAVSRPVARATGLAERLRG